MLFLHVFIFLAFVDLGERIRMEMLSDYEVAHIWKPGFKSTLSPHTSFLIQTRTLSKLDALKSRA